MAKSKQPRRPRRRRSPANDNLRTRTVAASATRARKRAKASGPKDGEHGPFAEAELSVPAEYLLPLLDDEA